MRNETAEDRKSGQHEGKPGSNGPTQVEVFYQYKELLFSIAYRMLGSAADAMKVIVSAIRFRAGMAA